jgi:RNA exonuclease 4
MAPELSSNWKKLQAQIKAESQPKVASANIGLKRKANQDQGGKSDPSKFLSNKRQRVVSGGEQSDNSKISGKRKGKANQINEASPQGHPKKRPEARTVTVKDRISVKEVSEGKPRKTSANPKPAKRPMGNAQSSRPQDVPKTTITPSLALWAEDNGISSEALAEAYGLGIKDTSIIKDASSVKPNQGLAPDIELGKYIAMDCEMVGIGENGYESALARVSVVDFHGRQVYDSYVRPKERVTDWRTHVSGVASKHMVEARSFEEVQTQVAGLLKDRVLVGHDLRHDLQALLLEHPSRLTRDTARFSGFRKYGHGPKPALRVLAKEILDVEIQAGQHSSIEDARVAMLLFRRHKSAFDAEHANRFGEDKIGQQKSKPRQKKTKKKRKN